MKRLLLSLVFLAACSKKSAPQPSERVVYSNPTSSFSCTIPGQWKVDEKDLKRAVPSVAFYSPPSGPHPYSAVIRIQHYLKGADPINDSPQKYIQGVESVSESVAKETGDSSALFFPSPYPWNGQTGFHFTTIEALPAMNHPWDGKEESYGTGIIKLRDEEVVLPAPDGFYVLSYESDPKRSADGEAVFQNVLKTFALPNTNSTRAGS